MDPTTGQCSFIDSADVTVLKPAYIPPATNVRQSLLVVIVDAPACGAAAASGATVSNLQSLYFGPNLDGKGGWAVRLENCRCVHAPEQWAHVDTRCFPEPRYASLPYKPLTPRTPRPVPTFPAQLWRGGVGAPHQRPDPVRHRHAQLLMVGSDRMVAKWPCPQLAGCRQQGRR